MMLLEARRPLDGHQVLHKRQRDYWGGATIQIQAGSTTLSYVHLDIGKLVLSLN